jgi:hypothetical protein
MNEFSQSEALELLVKKVYEYDLDLGGALQAAVAGGKDTRESKPVNDRRRKTQEYRKVSPFTEQEAVTIALEVIKSALIELPMIINQSLVNFKDTEVIEKPAMRIRRRDHFYRTEDDDALSESDADRSRIVVDLTSETQLETDSKDIIPLEYLSDVKLGELIELFETLKALAET